MPEDLPKLIHPQGPESALIMLVTDSPTEDDQKAGKLFYGRYTSVIKELFSEIKVKIESTYRTSLFKERLVYNGTNKKPLREAVNLALSHRDYRKLLVDEILNIRPKVVVPLGEISFNFLTGEKSLSNFRGSVLPLRQEIISQDPFLSSVKVVPSLSPRDLYVDPSAKVYTRIDYERISSIVNGTFVQEDANVFLPKTIGEVLEWFHKFKKPLGVLDIEARFSIPVCIGFSFDRNNAMVVPLIDNKFDKAVLVEFWKIIEKILQECSWVNQNMKYDLHRLRWFGFQDYRIVGDTALRATCIYPEFEKKLAFLNSIYTDMPYFKGEGKNAGGGDKVRFYTYCGKDCISTYRIYQEQEKEIEELGIRTYVDKVQELFWPYVRMERRGIGIDEQERQKLLAYYELKFYTYRETIRFKLNEPTFNPMSGEQNCNLFYKRFKLPTIINKKTGQPTSDEEAIDTHCVDNCNDDPFKYLILQLIRGCKKIHKVIEALQTVRHPDGRMRCSYDLGGTNTGRSAGKKVSEDSLYIDYSLKNPTIKTQDLGHSLQTFGKHEFFVLGEKFGHDLRNIFVPSNGFIFSEGDLSQAEARVDCVLAKDWDFLPEFDKKPGVHCLTGSWIFECQPGDILKGTEKYHIAKIARHAGERNMYPSRLARMIQRDIVFCTEVLNRLHNTQPNIRGVFHDEVRKVILEKRFLLSPTGFRRDFFGKVDHEMYNQAISTLPQNIVAKQMQFSIPLLEKRFEGHDVHFVYEGHDSLMAEIRPDFKDEFASNFRSVVERPIDFRNCSLPRDFDLVIPTEIEFGENWGQMKKYGK